MTVSTFLVQATVDLRGEWIYFWYDLLHRTGSESQTHQIVLWGDGPLCQSGSHCPDVQMNNYIEMYVISLML